MFKRFQFKTQEKSEDKLHINVYLLDVEDKETLVATFESTPETSSVCFIDTISSKLEKVHTDHIVDKLNDFCSFHYGEYVLWSFVIESRYYNQKKKKIKN